jgi:hypothetical protein
MREKQQRVFQGSKTSWRIAPGTWVRMRHSRSIIGSYGRIIEVEGNGDAALYSIETDGCRDIAAIRSDFRVIMDRQPPHPWFPMRKTLPYGRYIIGDGSVVLHNRDYQPIMRIADGKAMPCNPSERVTYEAHEWIYGGDSGRSAPWRDEETFKHCVWLLTNPNE